MEINNVNTEIKGLGVAMTAPAMDREDRVKPQVAPVADGTESTGAALGGKELHRQVDKDKKSPTKPSVEDLTKAVAEIQSRLQSMGSSLDFAVNKDPDAVVVRVTNRETGDLIRQFPSEQVLQLNKKLQELTGLLFDEKA